MGETLNFFRRIRDPVHGLIRFGGSGDRHRDKTDQIAWKLLNTKEFQRLRRIRQLGFSDLVFPGATHSRLAHSIGVYHMARSLSDIISRQQNHKIRQENRQNERAALLAALLHDVGHGPFSHVFEQVGNAIGKPMKHEEWSTKIVCGETEVNKVLTEFDQELPDQVRKFIDESNSANIYGTIVSSQFDADRLDYVQRDRLMTGVEFGHIDIEWLFDNIKVGEITIEEKMKPYKSPCLYLGPKGVQIAEEYLQARSRLYKMVYMHKTTRAAEAMLAKLLQMVHKTFHKHSPIPDDHLTQYLLASKPDLDLFLKLDDAKIWSSLEIYSLSDDEMISELARRLLKRELYKCIEINEKAGPGGNLFGRFKFALKEEGSGLYDKCLFDNPKVKSYQWYSFNDDSALNKVLVKTDVNMPEPEDIISVSEHVKLLREESHFQRAYVPNDKVKSRCEEILQGI